jgi:hypothetical protein
MNEPPSNFPERTPKSRIKPVTWFVLLFVASSVTIFCIGLLTENNPHVPDLLGFAAVLALILTALASAALPIGHWLFKWRNFRRVLFGIACLVTLIALAYAEENWRGKHAWQKHRRQWEAMGEKFALAALVPPPVSDEKNFACASIFMPALDVVQGPSGAVWRDTNAMARLEQLSAELSPSRGSDDHLVLGNLEKGTFADVEACADFYRDNTNYPQAPLSATAAETILTALGKFDSELKELREAAATRPYSRFSIQYEYEPPWAILLPHLARLKALTKLTHVRAIAQLEALRPAEAFADLKLGLRFSESMHDEPLLIDHLVRIATLAINLQTVREGLVRHAWTEPQLLELETYLSAIDLLGEYKLAMRGERALSITGLDYLRRSHFRSNPMDYISDDGGSSRATGGFGLMPGGWFYQNMLTISEIDQNFILPAVDERSRRVFPDLSENAARHIEKLPRSPYTIFARLFLPALDKAVRRSARMQTSADSARVACALERYRLANSKLPENLDALLPSFLKDLPHDIIDGKPLRYRPNPDGRYVLYSVGWNQTDDGGHLAWTKERKDLDATKGDWVLQMSGR